MDILLTAAIGDVLCLTARWSEEFSDSIQTAFWASPVQHDLIPLFKRAYPHTTSVIVYDDWRVRKVILSKAHLADCGLQLPDHVQDWSVFTRFGKLPPMGTSRFLTTDLADVDHLGLPDEYIAINATTTRNPATHRRLREFQPEDWEATLSILESHDSPGVVIGLGDDRIPDHPLLIDLRDRTTLGEGMEIVKQASGLLTIDSWPSVLGSWCSYRHGMQIKAVNSWLLGNRGDYYGSENVVLNSYIQP